MKIDERNELVASPFSTCRVKCSSVRVTSFSVTRSMSL